MNELLNAALAHYEAGNAVIAVTQDKKPYREGWNEFFTQAANRSRSQRAFFQWRLWRGDGALAGESLRGFRL